MFVIHVLVPFSFNKRVCRWVMDVRGTFYTHTDRFPILLRQTFQIPIMAFFVKNQQAHTQTPHYTHTQNSITEEISERQTTAAAAKAKQ